MSALLLAKYVIRKRLHQLSHLQVDMLRPVVSETAHMLRINEDCGARHDVAEVGHPTLRVHFLTLEPGVEMS